MLFIICREFCWKCTDITRCIFFSCSNVTLDARIYQLETFRSFKLPNNCAFIEAKFNLRIPSSPSHGNCIGNNYKTMVTPTAPKCYNCCSASNLSASDTTTCRLEIPKIQYLYLAPSLFDGVDLSSLPFRTGPSIKNKLPS